MVVFVLLWEHSSYHGNHMTGKADDIYYVALYRKRSLTSVVAKTYGQGMILAEFHQDSFPKQRCLKGIPEGKAVL